MKRKVFIGLALLTALVAVNVAFIVNLRNLPYANYYVLLLAINIDLLALIIIMAVILRKLIKIYIGTRRNILRRKLANILFFSLFLPLLVLNVFSTVVVIQSTKTYLSSKTRALSSSAEQVYRNLYDYELARVQMFREVVTALLEGGFFEELNGLGDVESVVRVPACDYEVSEGEMGYTLCVTTDRGSYRVILRKDADLIRNVSSFGKLALDVRAFVKTRDIITGVFVFFIVFIALLTALATVWLSMLVARHVSEPIERLSERAMKIAEGNLDVEVEEENTGDEIERLSKAFRKMKENLKEMYERLKRERDLLEKLLDALPLGILYVGKNGLRTNRTFREMFGDSPDMEAVLKRASEDANLRIEHLRGSEGDLYLIEDISSIVLAERFKTWQDAVKRIAHEIKNPLTPIRLNLERLGRYAERGEIDAEKFRDLVNLILKEIERISDLINQFRHLTPSRSLRLERFRLSDLVRDLRKLYS
ncbi:MAG TPA: HAMP domain-containing protein, partial [Aquifex aeolicus]|nr:HAMP domain-containing protein [Aquifex aeolicus]